MISNITSICNRRAARCITFRPSSERETNVRDVEAHIPSATSSCPRERSSTMVTIVDIGANGASFPCGILSPQASAEHLRDRCREVVFSDNLNCILASGDTVHFKAPRGYSCVGRISKICRGNYCPPPGLTKLNFQPKPGDDASVQIRLLLPLSGYPVIEALQIPHNSESFLELPELVQTNLFTVVSLSVVRASAFALHKIDCVNQKYGPVDLR